MVITKNVLMSYVYNFSISYVTNTDNETKSLFEIKLNGVFHHIVTVINYLRG